MIRGETLNFALIPTLYTELDADESVVPAHVELSNGRLTDGAHWQKRPGYGPVGGLYSTGFEAPLTCLIPQDTGLAIDTNGRVFELGDGSVTQLSGAVPYFSTPDFAFYDQVIVVAAGKQLCILDPDNKVNVEDQTDDVKAIVSAPHARFVLLLNDRLIAYGNDPYVWRYSGPGNLQSWPGGNFKEVERDGSTLQRMMVLRGLIYAFKTKKIEVWSNVGGVAVYSRSQKIDKGTLSPRSVVQANDTLFFYGSDGDFYSLDGASPRVISRAIRPTLDALTVRTNCYGFDFRAEHVVRWFFPTNGLCVAYDYATETWSDEYTWRDAGRWRLDVGAHMELSDGRTVIADYKATGLLYQWSRDYQSDAGEEVRVIRRATIPANKVGRKARINRLTMRAARGVADGPADTPHFFIRWRVDHQDWSDLTDFDLGVEGDTDPYIDLYSLGVGREVQVEIVETDAVKWLLTDGFITARALGR